MEADELERLRSRVSDHYAMLTRFERAGQARMSWGPLFERYDELLQRLAEDVGRFSSPPLPWTDEQRIEMDERCRAAGLVSGGPLARVPPSGR